MPLTLDKFIEKLKNTYLDKNSKVKIRVVFASLLTAASFILLITFLFFNKSNNNNSTYLIKSKNFNINVLARGELKPAKVFAIKSKISGKNSKLIWIIPEGSSVVKGDVIAKFDKSDYQEELTIAEQKVADAKSSFLLAQKSLAIQKEVENKAVKNSETQLELAILKSKDILEGSGILLKVKLDLELDQSKRTYQISQEELADYDLLLKKGHVSKRERAKVADTTRQLLELNKLKEKELINFEKYGWPKLKREAEITKETAQADYQQGLRLSELEIQNYRNAIIKAARDLQRAEKKMLVVTANIANCNVIAPNSGQIFYTSLPKANGIRKIQVGDNVWSGQTFMEIPDNKQLIFEATIREFDLARIKTGQTAVLTLDAFAGSKIDAHVKLVNTLANENTKTKVNRFSVLLKIPNTIDNGHAGMYGQAEILVTKVTNEIVVPVNFIQMNSSGYWVWRDTQHTEKTAVEIGLRNHQWAVITSGLELNETISL